MKIVLSNSTSPDVIQLFSEYDDFIIEFLGKDSICYTRYNLKEEIKDVWVVYCDDIAVGCVAYRIKEPGVGEVKRLFIRCKYRGLGISKLLLSTVEAYARQRGDYTLYLDTRVTLEPAISLYHRFGFVEISCNGLYVELEKRLKT